MITFMQNTHRKFSNGLTESHNNKIKLIKGRCIVVVTLTYSALEYCLDSINSTKNQKFLHPRSVCQYAC